MNPPYLRVVPTDTEAEQHLLGAFLCDNRLLESAEILQPEHFANALHARLFEALRKLIARGEVADLITLKAIFDQDSALREECAGRYLSQLVAAGATTVIEVKDYAALV